MELIVSIDLDGKHIRVILHQCVDCGEMYTENSVEKIHFEDGSLHYVCWRCIELGDDEQTGQHSTDLPRR